MSHTIHSMPRPNLPANDTRMTMRAIAGLQDATTFQDARDVLLRYYYPVVRTFTETDLRDQGPKGSHARDMEEWSVDLLHSGSRTSAALFFEKVQYKTDRFDTEQVQQLADELQGVVKEARRAQGATPYERVGRVLAWLKEARTKQPDFQWEHSGLRQWMQGLLTDFTLADAKKHPGALLDNPEQRYAAVLASWSAEHTGLPFDELWQIKGQPWFIKNAAGGSSDFDQHSGNVLETGMNLRAKLLQNAAPAMGLLLHPNLGVTRLLKPSWRDVTDYGVLHPLLTLDEASFDKSVWLDLLQHKGKKWSSPANAGKWHAWQEAAQTSYQVILQNYMGSTPQGVIQLEKTDHGDNPLKPTARSPLELDWYRIFTELACRFPYFNEAPEFETLVKSKLNPAQFEQFKQDSHVRVGKPFILSLIDLPWRLEKKDAFNMPKWFHARLQEEMTEKPRLELPSGLLDDSQAPPLY